MRGLTCKACNKKFKDDSDYKLHSKSEWHRNNRKRKVAGVPGLTEARFLARQAALAKEKSKAKPNGPPMFYGCGICKKEYRSRKALDQHFSSRRHVSRVSQGTGNQDITTVRPLPAPAVNKPIPGKNLGNVESEDGDLNLLDPSCCFMCDRKHDSIEKCIVHMHKRHGFFIPDIEYLTDPKGLLTYLGLKVTRDFTCLYCNELCHPFDSLEAHCKVHYGDDREEEEGELEDFYDYSSRFGPVTSYISYSHAPRPLSKLRSPRSFSYIDEDGKQLVAVGDPGTNVTLGTAGWELIITRRTDTGVSTKSLGSREYMRYYRQKPRPTSTQDVALTIALASSYRRMGLPTAQSREQKMRMKVMKEIMKEMNRSGVEAMRSKIAMKSNVIRNLPRNVPY